jgi:hypothetical protein
MSFSDSSLATAVRRALRFNLVKVFGCFNVCSAHCQIPVLFSQIEFIYVTDFDLIPRPRLLPPKLVAGHNRDEAEEGMLEEGRLVYDEAAEALAVVYSSRLGLRGLGAKMAG